MHSEYLPVAHAHKCYLAAFYTGSEFSTMPLAINLLWQSNTLDGRKK